MYIFRWFLFSRIEIRQRACIWIGCMAYIKYAFGRVSSIPYIGTSTVCTVTICHEGRRISLPDLSSQKPVKPEIWNSASILDFMLESSSMGHERGWLDPSPVRASYKWSTVVCRLSSAHVHGEYFSMILQDRSKRGRSLPNYSDLSESEKMEIAIASSKSREMCQSTRRRVAPIHARCILVAVVKQLAAAIFTFRKRKNRTKTASCTSCPTNWNRCFVFSSNSDPVRDALISWESHDNGWLVCPIFRSSDDYRNDSG